MIPNLRCTATTKLGRRCQCRVVKVGAAYCKYHDPLLKELTFAENAANARQKAEKAAAEIAPRPSLMLPEGDAP
jgi:hypothetical protein